MELPDDVMNETNELLSALIKEVGLPPIDENEVTAPMLAAVIHANESTARHILERKIASGEYKKRYVKMPNGMRSIAYSKK